MAATRRRPAIILAGLLLGLLAVNLQGVQGEELEKVPSEDQCRPYIEKALKDLGTEGSEEEEEEEVLLLLSPDDAADGGDDEATAAADDDDDETGDDLLGTDAIDLDDESTSREKRSVSEREETSENEQPDADEETTVEVTSVEDESVLQEIDSDNNKEEEEEEEDDEQTAATGESKEDDEQQPEEAADASGEESDQANNDEADDEGDGDAESSVEAAASKEESDGGDGDDNELPADESAQQEAVESEEQTADAEAESEDQKSVEEEAIVAEEAVPTEQSLEKDDASAQSEQENADQDDANKDDKSEETSKTAAEQGDGGSQEEKDEEEGEEDAASPEEEELIMEIEVPEVLRPREHIGQLLKLDEDNEEKEKAVERIADVVLRDLKRLYDNAIKPLETLYKYRDLSNRHFGDPEIFSKPLVLFMGPWSGGKSSIINYLLDIEYKPTSLRTGAEPSPAYFNILMHGEEEEVLDGTQLAADWTFSGLQKFGQGLLDRLKGYKLKSKLLEKVNIVEIPGILEIRKQVQRLFPFNDACQWFIDRADIIFLVYDPAKLDVGPETEAILDQLKGREYQTRIILNKADQVRPEELMRVQGALIWNISPLMSSAEPPVMYSTSLWSIPYEAGAPTRLLYAQERAFLRDLRSAVDKRVEHKIASARRFAVRVRNHAKMVDCYLTTYYNHKSFFAKKKDVAQRIVESPQDYHIYEGLSTLTNISRYDLPDPDVYRDFFRLNDLYEFPLLSSTCTYFRGCPINRLDVAIAYDLPELVGKYKKSAEAASQQVEQALAAAAATEAPPARQAQQAQPAQTTHKAKSDASKMSLS